MEQRRQAFVAAATGVQDGPRRHAKRQSARIDDDQPIRMQIQEDVAALCVRAMHQRIHQQLANNALVVGGQFLAVQTRRQFVAFVEVGHRLPYRVHQFDG